MNDTNFVENFSYNIDGRVKQYVKRFFGELLNTCGDIEPTSYDVKSYDNSEDWRYRYSPLGGREQKRLYYSPQGDGKCYPFSNYHPWTYYVLGANGEQTAVYKGVQTSDQDTCNNSTRRVNMYAHSFINAGGMLVNLANLGKQYNFLDNLGSVRVTIDANGILGYDYKPFGDTLLADGENRIGFAAQERDEESRYFAMGARQYDCTIRNNSPLEGWQTKSDGVESSKKNQLPLFNYFSLPKNKNLIEKAKELRKAGNLSEVIFWKTFKNKELLGWDIDRQVILGNYIVDFIINELGLVFEIDGYSHNLKGEYDLERESYLESLNLEIIHFRDIEIKKDIENVKKSVKFAIEKRINDLRKADD